MQSPRAPDDSSWCLRPGVLRDRGRSTCRSPIMPSTRPPAPEGPLALRPALLAGERVKANAAASHLLPRLPLGDQRRPEAEGTATWESVLMTTLRLHPLQGTAEPGWCWCRGRVGSRRRSAARPIGSGLLGRTQGTTPGAGRHRAPPEHSCSARPRVTHGHPAFPKPPRRLSCAAAAENRR